MAQSTNSPLGSDSRVRSCLFTRVASAILLFFAGCNMVFPTSTDEGDSPTLVSSVTGGDSDPGGSAAPAGDSGSNLQPSLSISAKRVFCCDPLSIDFDAVHADPFDAGRASRYRWDFGDGFSSYGKTVNHTYGRPATYKVEVVTTYADGTSELSDTTLTVGMSEPSPATPPAGDDSSAETADGVSADAGPDQTINAGEVVLLDGANSRGAGTMTLAHVWRQTSGPAVQLLTLNAARTTFVAPTDHLHPLTLTFELTVRDAASSDRDVVRVTVVPLETTPEAIDPTVPSKEELTAWMASLPPLSKVHYSCPDIFLELDDPRFKEYVRITRAASVSGEWSTSSQIHAVVRICKQVNAASPPTAVPVTMAINYSPWHRVFGADLPPTDIGPAHVAELSKFRERLSLVRQWLADANLAHHSDIRVSAVLLDSERFSVKPASDPTSAVWNAAMDAKYKAVFDIAGELYPDARLEWFDRGIHESNAPSGWGPIPYFTYREPGDAFSCELYSVPELGRMRETFRRTYDFAIQHGIRSVTPWVALGAGYRRQADNSRVWETDWDYDTVFSMQLGREINVPSYGQQPDHYAPWGAAEIVVFYPPPFDSRTPAWGKHFVEYARGAADLP